MPRRPQLMVLYTNDAVEVRYSDGSQLHMLPCASSFTFHTPQDGAHPANGMEMIQQRCPFVTSAYKNMVLSALDFRNRFAERPYVCEDLLEADQVVHLYAKIEDIAWPKEVTSDNTEVLADGSVCITSEDEFASIILSAHRCDFTMCYLSLLSKEKQRQRTTVKNRDKSKHKHGHDTKHGQRNFTEVSKPERFTGSSTNMPDVVPVDKEVVRFERPPDRLVGCDRDDLNISPITQASCADSPQALSNASNSPITPQNAVKDNEAKFRPFSTPTEGLEDNESPECTPYGKTAVFQDYLKVKAQSSVRFAPSNDGSFIDNTFPEEKFDCNQNQRTEKPPGYDHNSSELKEVCKTSSGKQCIDPGIDNSSSSHRTSNSADNVPQCSQGSGTSLSIRSCGDGESETRYQYTWLTRHVSCEESPANLAPIVKMAKEVLESGRKSMSQGKENKYLKDRKQTDTSKLRQINCSRCHMSKVPLPLPLSCPGQHLHKMQTRRAYDDGKNPLEDLTTFSQGRLKVLLVDGIIFRIVRHATMKIVEVYPGDGSVLVSQGMSAHFFLHIIPHGEQLEERTYSIKSPPPSVKGNYSVKSLMSRAHRFLSYVRQEETAIPASIGLFCWKHEEPEMVEPEATTVLEECDIQGYGKFTALSNGQVRIAFKDRTCLDMMWDFSSRLQRSSTVDETKKHEMRELSDKTAGTCRLLLPSGQYQMIDIQQPGLYKRYVDIAKEWATWVNSSPVQRQTFYKQKDDTNMQMSVARELQKIQCFNYIVDNTLSKKTGSVTTCQPGAFRPYSATQQKPGPSILRHPDQAKERHDKPVCDFHHRTVQIQQPATHWHKSTYSVNSENREPSVTVYGRGREFNSNLNAKTMERFGNPNSAPFSANRTQSAFEGFTSVREALLRTSNVIKDIDQLLDKK